MLGNKGVTNGICRENKTFPHTRGMEHREGSQRRTQRGNATADAEADARKETEREQTNQPLLNERFTSFYALVLDSGISDRSAGRLARRGVAQLRQSNERRSSVPLTEHPTRSSFT